MRKLALLFAFLCLAFFSYGQPSASADDACALACATQMYSLPGVRYMHRLKAACPEATLQVEKLPKGLVWNAERCRVEGTIKKKGQYSYVVLISHNGQTRRDTVRLTVSDDLVQPTPLMGWLSWNVFEEEIDEEKMLAVAHAAKHYGLDTLGYRYLCLDDWWHSGSERPEGEYPDYDHVKFPHGMAWLADTLHRMGFKIGIYSDAAEHTCAGAFGSLGYEAADARQYAEWGMDLLKYDYCGAPNDMAEAQRRYTTMGRALEASGRKILFYMCEWGQLAPWLWASETGATCWRTTYDSRDFWDWRGYDDSGHVGVVQGLDGMKNLWPYSGVNRFNDADMMMVGLHGTGKSSSFDAQHYLDITGQPQYVGMTQEEYQSQFSLWAMMSSPLTLSFDIRHISDDDLRIISNTEMIRINQDAMGQQAEVVCDTLLSGGQRVEVFLKELANGDIAVAVFNRADSPATLCLTPAMLRLQGADLLFHDVWGVSSRDRFMPSDGLPVKVESHQTRVFRVKRV